jgi:Ca2+-binding RTX toxin-like protein
MKRLLAAAAAALTLPGVASAATVSVGGGTHVDFVGAAGEVNHVTVEYLKPWIVVVRDTAATVRASGRNCFAYRDVDDPLSTAHAAICITAIAKAAPARVDAGDRGDVLEAANGTVVFLGGEGNDVAHGSAAADSLDGGPGDDRLYAGAGGDVLVGDWGNDELYGEAGFDRMLGGNGDDLLAGGDDPDLLHAEDGNDVLDGGAGADELFPDDGADLVRGGPDGTRMDRVSYAGRFGPVNVSLDGVANDGSAGEGDNVMPDVEEIYGGDGADTLSVVDPPAPANRPYDFSLFGGAGNDTLIGAGGRDDLFGGFGNDVLRGNAGQDRFGPLSGDPGDDTIFARDGVSDITLCGPGSDTAELDVGLDSPLLDCETLLP